MSSKINHHWTRLSLLKSRGNLSSCDKVLMMLNIGLDILDMDAGIISHVIGSTYLVQNSTNKQYINKQWDVSQTFCDLTIHHNAIVDLAYIPADFKQHPAYHKFRVESYLGIPYTVCGQVSGTIAYLKSESRCHDFTAEELHFMTKLSERITRTLETSTVR